MGDVSVMSTMAALYAHALLKAGQIGAAWAQVAVAREAGSSDDVTTQGLAAGALAWLAALDGDRAAADRYAADAVARMEASEQLEDRPLIHIACAEAAAVLGDPTSADHPPEGGDRDVCSQSNVVAVARQRALL